MYRRFWQDSDSSLSALCKFQMYITRIHMFNPLLIIIWYMFHYFWWLQVAFSTFCAIELDFTIKWLASLSILTRIRFCHKCKVHNALYCKVIHSKVDLFLGMLVKIKIQASGIVYAMHMPWFMSVISLAFKNWPEHDRKS